MIIDNLPHREKLVQRTAVHYLCRDYSKDETLVPIYIPHIVLMSIDDKNVEKRKVNNEFGKYHR